MEILSKNIFPCYSEEYYKRLSHMAAKDGNPKNCCQFAQVIITWGTERTMTKVFQQVERNKLH